MIKHCGAVFDLPWWAVSGMGMAMARRRGRVPPGWLLFEAAKTSARGAAPGYW